MLVIKMKKQNNFIIEAALAMEDKVAVKILKDAEQLMIDTINKTVE